MKEWIAVLRAADMAARWHVHQRRKGIAQEPYVNHLLEVASLVAEATRGSDPTVVIAALLHDAVEDQGPLNNPALRHIHKRKRRKNGPLQSIPSGPSPYAPRRMPVRGNS
jgi:(p)ppGpp synthase/HD superfamily hydrolase